MMDVLMHHEEDGKVSVSINRKPTHTERHLPFSSHHPLSMKKSVMSSLLRRVDYVSEDSEKEVNHVMSVLKENGYPDVCLRSWRNRKKSAAKDEVERPKLSVCLPYVRGLSESVRRILRPLSIGVFFKPPVMEVDGDERS